MQHKTFIGLMRWELEEYLSLPVLSFLVASAIIAVLAQPITNISPEHSYVNLYYGSSTVFVILTLVAGVFFSRSFAGSMGRGEIKMMLSYPVKRWQVFLSKLTAMFLTIFVIYGVTYSLHLYLDALSLFEPMFYLSLCAFLLQLVLICAVSVAVSMVTKNEIMSTLAAVLLLLGLDSVIGVNNYLSAQGRFRFLFQYFGKLTHGSLPLGDNLIVTVEDIIVAVSIPVLIFAFLLILSFMYFTRAMEVD